MPDINGINEEQAFAIDFNVPDVATALGLPIPDEAAALMLRVPLDAYRAYCEAAADEVTHAAHDLLQDQVVAGMVETFPQREGGFTLLTIGDSITTYRYSYAELLRHLLAGRGVNLINRGHSGYTSTHGLELTYTQFLALNPDMVTVMYGVNDCKRFGEDPFYTLVGMDEYRNNLSDIVKAFRRYTAARVLLVTPTPVLEKTVNSNPDIMAMRLKWDNTDLQRYAVIAREVGAAHSVPVIDLMTPMMDVVDGVLYCADGLHPNAMGHRVMLAEMAKQWVGFFGEKGV